MVASPRARLSSELFTKTDVDGPEARGFSIPISVLNAPARRDLTAGSATQGQHLVDTLGIWPDSFIGTLRNLTFAVAAGGTTCASRSRWLLSWDSSNAFTHVRSRMPDEDERLPLRFDGLIDRKIEGAAMAIVCPLGRRVNQFEMSATDGPVYHGSLERFIGEELTGNDSR